LVNIDHVTIFISVAPGAGWPPMPAEEINPGQYCKVVNIAQAGLLSRAILGWLQESRFRRRPPGLRGISVHP